MKTFYRRIAHLVLRQPSAIGTLYRLRLYAKGLRKQLSRIVDTDVPPPVTITVRLTNRCNLRCIQCGQWGERGVYKESKKSFIFDELNTEQFKSFLNQVSHFKPYIFFAGGEPLLREDLAELLYFSVSRGMLTGVNSNCTLLSEDLAEKIIRARLTYFYASIDGPEEIDNKIRLGKDSFKKALTGIKTLIKVRERLKAKLPIIQIDTVITYENHKYILDMARLVNELNADAFGLIAEIFTTSQLNRETTIAYKREFGTEPEFWSGFIRDRFGKMDTEYIEKQIHTIITSKWRFKFRPYPPIATNGFNFDLYFNHPEKPLDNYLCVVPWAYSQLMPNGDITCCGNHPDYIAGNILHGDFLNIWNNDRYERFRNVIRQSVFPSCFRCYGLYNFL